MAKSPPRQRDPPIFPLAGAPLHRSTQPQSPAPCRTVPTATTTANQHLRSPLFPLAVMAASSSRFLTRRDPRHVLHPPPFVRHLQAKKRETERVIEIKMDDRFPPATYFHYSPSGIHSPHHSIRSPAPPERERFLDCNSDGEHSKRDIWLNSTSVEDFENFWSACPWDEDLRFATAVCEKVDVPLQVVHLTDEYWNNVVSYMIDEYRSGRTPNPDVLCNTRIKFGAFLEAVDGMKFDYIASGHYAHVTHSSSDQEKVPSILSLSKDMVKDQTYFLSHLSQSQLKRLLFPLGCISKDEVRSLATLMDLPNKDRKDSQGICFLGKVKFSEFVAKHIGEMEGVLLEAETGDYLGNHKGFWFYTIGQRQGLGLPGGPWYVVEKDVHNNVVFVSRHYYSFDKRRRTFRVGSPKWISGSPPKNSQLRCKVRHGPSFHDCSITIKLDDDSCREVVTVHLSEDDQGLAAGQYAAFYDGEVCVGSGVILDSRDDKSFPICDKALEIAQLKDKSKLGKPVRIMNL